MEDFNDIDSGYESFAGFLEKLFELRSIEGHLCFFEDWLELVMTTKFFTHRNNPFDLLYFYDQFTTLYELSFEISNDEVAFEKLNTLVSPNVADQSLSHLSRYLSEEEKINPLLAIRAVFAEYDLTYYKPALRDWLENSLNNCVSDCISKCIFPLYSSSKKLIEACWLIHERIIARDGFSKPAQLNNDFEYTCPFLLNDSYKDNPFLLLDEFFKQDDLPGYRKELKDWMKVVMQEKVCCEHASNLLFLYRQLIQLLQAAYLIVNRELKYEPKSWYSEGESSLKDWMLRARNRSIENGAYFIQDYEVKVLESKYHLNPMEFLQQEINFNYVVKLRNAMLDWLFAGFSTEYILNPEDLQLACEMHESLVKIIEAFHLIVINDGDDKMLN